MIQVESSSNLLGVNGKKKRLKAPERKSPKHDEHKLGIQCVMTQDNQSASHHAGYTALLLDVRRGGMIAVTADHNMVLLTPRLSPTNGTVAESKLRKGAGAGSLTTTRQIVGFNDEIIDIKSVPEGVLSTKETARGEGDGGHEHETEPAQSCWIAVATNSPQVTSCPVVSHCLA